MRRSGFVTILTMRLLLLPYDLVSVMAGLLRIDDRALLLAMVLGSLPATGALVLAGAAIEGDVRGALPHFDGCVFVASALLFAGSLLIAHQLKRCEQQR